MGVIHQIIRAAQIEHYWSLDRPDDGCASPPTLDRNFWPVRVLWLYVAKCLSPGCQNISHIVEECVAWLVLEFICQLLGDVRCQIWALHNLVLFAVAHKTWRRSKWHAGIFPFLEAGLFAACQHDAPSVTDSLFLAALWIVA